MIDTIKKEQHRQAMIYVQEAMLAEQDNNPTQANLLYRKAFNLEKDVAMSFFFDEQKQPTRSVLFRSAAALAKSCGEYQEGLKLVSYGLSGNPPVEIADQLTQLGQQLEDLYDANQTNKRKTTNTASIHKFSSAVQSTSKPRFRPHLLKRRVRDGDTIRRIGKLTLVNKRGSTIQITSNSGDVTQIKLLPSEARLVKPYEGQQVKITAKKLGTGLVLYGDKPILLVRSNQRK